MEEMNLKVSIGVVMRRSEVEKFLWDNGYTFDSFDSEEEAFKWAAEEKYNEGWGCDVSVL